MDNHCRANAVAEAVVIWGMADDTDYLFEDDLYDDHTFECLNIFVTTTLNFSIVFEIEFEQIFSKHCDENMPEDQFLKFIEPRIKHLGKISGYFGYILPCVFVREIMYRCKHDLDCFHFATLARKCLSNFLESKLDKFDGNLYDLLDYCMNINRQFNELRPSKDASILNKKQKEHFIQESTSFAEKTDPDIKTIVESQILSLDRTVKDATDKLLSSNATNKNVHVNGGNGSDRKLSESSLMSQYSNQICDISKAISEISLKGETEQNESCKRDIIDDINKFHDNVSSLNNGVDLTAADEMEEMCKILMPVSEFRKEVFNLIEECEDILPIADNKADNI